MSVSVVLPALEDEKECIRAMRNELVKHVPQAEVVVDGSLGLANAIKLGIDRTTSSIVVVMDVDGTHPPKVLPYMIQLAEHFDLVCGSRLTWKRNTQGVFSWMGNQFVKRLLGIPIRDCTSGFFVCRKDKLAEVPNSIWHGYGDYYIELLRYATVHNWLMIEVPVAYQPRMAGQGHTAIAKHSIQYLWRAVRLIK